MTDAAADPSERLTVSAPNAEQDIALFANLLGEVLREHSRKRVLVVHAADGLDEISIAGPTHIAELADGEVTRRQITPGDFGLSEAPLAAYFSLAHIAEEVQSFLARRARISAGGRLWRGSFDHTLRQFAEDGVSPERFQALLDRLLYLPVFTAHPTEAKRRTTLETQRRIFLLMLDWRRSVLNGEEEQERMAEIVREIQILWKTDEVRVHKPQVMDEVRQGLYFFHASLFETLPRLYSNLEKAVRRAYGAHADISLPSFVRFGSWIGGDRGVVQHQGAEPSGPMHLGLRRVVAGPGEHAAAEQAGEAVDLAVLAQPVGQRAEHGRAARLDAIRHLVRPQHAAHQQVAPRRLQAAQGVLLRGAGLAEQTEQQGDGVRGEIRRRHLR